MKKRYVLIVGMLIILSSFMIKTNLNPDIIKAEVTDRYPPEISAASANPQTLGFGHNVTISSTVTDNQSGVQLVRINITYPDCTYGNFSMDTKQESTYEYIFSDTWQHGQYNYTIWVNDNANNTNISSQYNFTITAYATITLATLKDYYSENEYINITDPPNPTENLSVVDRNLTWNTYYNASSGDNILESFSGPVNYQDDSSTWMPINASLRQLTNNDSAYNYGYRIGNDHGLFGVYFKPNSQSEWPVAFTYNRSDNPTMYVVRSKLVGVGYVDAQNNWAYQYLQNVQSSQGQTTENSITYENVFTGTDVSWSYGTTRLKEEITLSNTTKAVLQSHPPSLYGLNNASSYLVFITKLEHQNLNIYNNSGLLAGNVTISDSGVDFKDALGQFRCALPLGEAYELHNASVRENLTYRIVHLNGNTYLLSGLKLTDLSAMTFPVVIDPTLSINSITNDGYIYKSNSNYNTVWSASNGTLSTSDTYLSIGQSKVASFPPDYRIRRGFLLFNTSSLPSNAFIDNTVLSLYKKDDYSATDFNITIQNGQPTYPTNPLQASDYNKNHYSGNGGSLDTSRFGDGWNDIVLTNLSWVNTTGLTKLCLRSSRDINCNTPTGNEYVNVYSADASLAGHEPKLTITYRNQSKIKNNGSTDIKGYLLIQMQYYDQNQNPAQWIVDSNVIHETTPRTITAGQQLALDTIFNGKIRGYNLSHSSGLYRVYAALRDSYGNVLVSSSGVQLVFSYAFYITLHYNSYYSKGFESGLGREWSFYYNNPEYARNERSTYSSHSGSYSWRMDVTESTPYNLNEVILHVKLKYASYLDLSLYTREYSDEQNLMPSSFVGHNKSDGIAVSTDRMNWVCFWQYPDSVSSWMDYGPFDIAESIDISGDVYIKFQQYDDWALPSDGILWDDISLHADGIIDIDPEFVLPAWGGAMVHSDPHLSDNINLPTPTPSSLGSEWSIYSSTGFGRNERNYFPEQIEDDNCNFWGMDVTDDDNDNLNELILHVKMSGGASYLNLDFDTLEYNDEQNLMSSQFIGHCNADGIAVSTDQTNWVRLWQYPSSVSAWTSYGSFDIGDAISLSGDVYIKFQQYGSNAVDADGIFWDDICLETDGTMALNSGDSISSYFEDFELIAWTNDDGWSEQSQNLGNGVAGNSEIVVCPFANFIGQDNLIVYDYDGNRLWESNDLLNGFTTSSSPMVSVDNKVIMCDSSKVIMFDPYFNEDGECLWSADFPFGDFHGTPMSPTITEDGVIILPMMGEFPLFGTAVLYAYSLDGDFLWRYDFNDMFITNSACVNGNRVYVITEPKGSGNSYLYAFDIGLETGFAFNEAWNDPYPYNGDSGASPTFIDDTLYFDAYRSNTDAEVHAVTDCGDVWGYKWPGNHISTQRYKTMFSMSADPRGGVWYEENVIVNPPEQLLLVRLYTNNGTVMETIDEDLLLETIGYQPLSVMEICNETKPTMIISANKFLDKNYVIAIDLEHPEKILWKTQINSSLNINYAGGQYTILLDNTMNNPRIIFVAYWGGVYAIGG